MLPTHLDLTLDGLAEDKIELLGDRVSQFVAFSPLPKLNNDIKKRRGWDGKSYTSFYKMAPIVLRDLLTEDERLCWYVVIVRFAAKN